MKKEIKNLKEELQKEKDSRIQLLADFVNYKKRVEIEKENLKTEVNKHLLNQIIDCIDDFDRALRLQDDKIDKDNDFYEGIMIIRKKFTNLLLENDLEEIVIEKGGRFDASTMEAVSMAPTDKKELKGNVIEVLTKGYMNKETKMVFKTAKVIIGK